VTLAWDLHTWDEHRDFHPVGPFVVAEDISRLVEAASCQDNNSLADHTALVASADLRAVAVVAAVEAVEQHLQKPMQMHQRQEALVNHHLRQSLVLTLAVIQEPMDVENPKLA
jgi:hypothetical protein